MFYMGFYNSL